MQSAVIRNDLEVAVRIGEHLCMLLSNLLPHHQKAGRESPDAYSEAEYSGAKDSLALYARHIDLKDKVVLDAGCGLGGKTVYYAEQGCRSIVGIDMDDNHIRYAEAFAAKKATANAEFKRGMLNELPFESDTFDIIILNDVVEHIDREILAKALTECKRVVKAGGRICMEFPPWQSHDAAHLDDYIHIPWMQVLFSSETLINVTKRMNPKPRHGKLSVIKHFEQLNRITTKEFKRIIRDLDFKVINLRHRMIKGIMCLRYVPFLNKYLTVRVIAVLSK